MSSSHLVSSGGPSRPRFPLPAHIDFSNGTIESMRRKFEDSQDSMEDFYRYVHALARAYLASAPGRPDFFNNKQVYNIIYPLLFGFDIRMSYGYLNRILNQLEYRLNLMEQTTQLCTFLGLRGLPRIQDVDLDFMHFDGWAWAEKDAYDFAVREIVEAKIFPEPTGEQGCSFHKPVHYLAMCMVKAPNRWDKECIGRAIDTMISHAVVLKWLSTLSNEPGPVIEEEEEEEEEEGEADTMSDCSTLRGDFPEASETRKNIEDSMKLEISGMCVVVRSKSMPELSGLRKKNNNGLAAAGKANDHRLRRLLSLWKNKL